VLVGSVLASGCGRISFAPIADGDAASDTASDDGVTGPAVCRPAVTTPFSTPVAFMGIKTNNDDGVPTLSSDQLTMIFKSNRTGGAGGYDLWQTTRASTATNTWTSPTLLSQVDVSTDDGSPELAVDDLTLWLSSDRASGTDYDVRVSTRATTGSAWSASTLVPELSSTFVDEGFTVLPSQLVGYMHSTRGDGFTAHIYGTTRPTTTALWTTPVVVSELDPGDAGNPWVAPDDCTMYFQSLRPGGVGAQDLWVVRRPTPTSPWGTPVNLTEVNSSSQDADPWLSADERTIIFATQRGGGGTYDLYVATR